MQPATATKIAFHAITLLHLYGITHGWETADGDLFLAYKITRFALMPALALYFIANTKLISDNNLKFVYCALFFSWLGDILLTYKTEINFLSGILAFSTAHVFYITYYLKETGFRHFSILKNKTYLTAPYILVVIFFILKTYDKMGWFAIPIGIYGTVLCSMSLMALNRFNNVASISFVTTYTGSILFVISDFMIGWNVFVETITNTSFAIMVTYIIGQYLIIEGLIKHLKLVYKS
jgi:uncharacterized membrane protein YhhN